MTTREVTNLTIKGIRKELRAMTMFKDILIVPGFGQISKEALRSYAIGPLPENDDSDLMTDYSAWSFGWNEKWVLELIKDKLNIQ